jgi:hypothetical protein
MWIKRVRASRPSAQALTCELAPPVAATWAGLRDGTREEASRLRLGGRNEGEIADRLDVGRTGS